MCVCVYIYIYIYILYKHKVKYMFNKGSNLNALLDRNKIWKPRY